MFPHSVRDHKELIGRESEELLGQPRFLLTQGFAMGGLSVLFVGRAVTDVAVDDDKRGNAGSVQEILVGLHQ